MISLVQLLREVQNNPQAIFLAGPAGSGKSYLSKQLLPQSFNTINSDDTYEEMLKASGIGLKQINFTPEQLSQASKMQAQSRKITQDKLAQALEGRQSVIIDGTGAASNPILKKKQELESLGYTTLMLMIYVSPLTSLQRNAERERSLMPGIVLRTWRDVNRNIDPNNANKSFSTALADSYIKQSTATGKPKSPEEQAKSDADKAQLNYDIENMVKTLPTFDTLQTAKSKINIFSNI